jgi:hypothetical protein
MADEEHLAILKRGVEAWNEWRERHPQVRPDLGGARLNGVTLFETIFANVDLSGCRHRQVKLEEDGEASKLARAANLCGSLGASDLGPHRERLRADGSALGGGEVIAMEAEEVVDLIVGGEEPLRLAG